MVSVQHDSVWMKRRVWPCLGLLLVLLAGLVAQGQAAELSIYSEKLLKLVVLQRHGVRTPTQSPEKLCQWTRHTWPEWPLWKAPAPVPEAKAGEQGLLTQRGADLVTAFWQQERQRLDNAGVWREGQCPEAGELVVYADVDERTQATALSLLEGLAPRCGLKYMTAPSPGPDPLFHPLRAGTAQLDAPAVIQRMEQRWGKGLLLLQERLQPALRELAAILGPLPSEAGRSATTSAVERPSRLVEKDGHGVSLKGGLDVASAVTEIFLLEYAQWPDQPAGWGKVDDVVLRRLLPLHTECSAVLNRDPDMARAGAGALAQSIACILEGTHPDKRYNDARIVIFVGHDTNIAQLGGLLGLRWHTEGYAPLQTPPGSALVFALYQRGEEQLVRVYFVTQSLETLHQRQVRPAPLLCTAIPLFCLKGSEECRLRDFRQVVAAALRGTPPEQK